MNWDTYKEMSFELRQEYDFRFSNKPVIQGYELLKTVSVLISMILALTVISYVIVTSPDLIEFKETYMQIMSATFDIIQYGTFFVFIFVMINFANYLFFYFKEWMWLSKHNIKRQKETFRWWKK